MAAEFILNDKIKLPERKLQVLGMAINGATVSEIGILLGISPNTARNHLYGTSREEGAIEKVEEQLGLHTDDTAHGWQTKLLEAGAFNIRLDDNSTLVENPDLRVNQDRLSECIPGKPGELVGLLVQGFTPSQIGKALDKSEKTVINQIYGPSNIVSKTGIPSANGVFERIEEQTGNRPGNRQEAILSLIDLGVIIP